MTSQAETTPPMMKPLRPLILSGQYVELRPLQLDDAQALWSAHTPDLTCWFPYPLQSLAQTTAWIEQALSAAAAGTALPWITISRIDGAIIGSTRFANASLIDRRVEIGWTFIGAAYQGGPFNSEAKLLQFNHAFETLGAIRVELKADGLNQRSRAAIAAIGATEEGVLRAHTATASGRQRDTVYFSVLNHEWPTVQTQLEKRIARHAARWLGDRQAL